MLSFICLFFPAVLFVWVYEGLSKSDLSLKRWLCMYCTGVIFINLICWLVMRFVLNMGYIYLYDAQLDITPALASNYMVLALPIALILSVAAALLRKNVKVTVEEPEHA